VAGKQVQDAQDRLQELRRQQLCFIQHDDAIDDIVQLAAARSTGREQGFEELHAGGNDNGRVPVLARQAAAKVLTTGVGLGVAVVLDDRLAKNASKHLGGLFDDAGIGNDIMMRRLPCAMA